MEYIYIKKIIKCLHVKIKMRHLKQKVKRDRGSSIFHFGLVKLRHFAHDLTILPTCSARKRRPPCPQIHKYPSFGLVRI